MKISRWFPVPHLAAAWLLLLPSPALAGPILGQVDTFEDGTTRNWTVGIGPGLGTHPAPPVNIPDGGPAGPGDNFMRLTSTGGAGSGSRLSVLNTSQWAGNYLAAGITAIEMDLNNLGQSDLFLRLMIAGSTSGPPTNVAFSRDPVFVPAGSGWRRGVFPIGPSDLIPGLGSVNAALTNATELRLYHSPAPLFPNLLTSIPPVVARLGVDNISAVPEPSSDILAAAGLLMLIGWRAGVWCGRKRLRGSFHSGF